jgi:hypothetical protein
MYELRKKNNLANSIAIYGRGRELSRPPTYSSKSHHPRTPVNHTGYIADLYKGAEAALLQIYSYQIFALEIFVPQV